MSDQEAIQQVINRYTDGCNRQDWPQVLGTFTEDAVWEAGGPGLTGHATIQAAMSGFLATVDYFIQSASASVIMIEGDRATARTTIRECGKFKDRDEALEVLGSYADELVRTPAGWQFAHRKFTNYGAHRFAIVPGLGF